MVHGQQGKKRLHSLTVSLHASWTQTLRAEVMPHGDTGVNLPVNLRRLILNAQTKFNIKPHRPGYTNLGPLEVVKKNGPAHWCLAIMSAAAEGCVRQAQEGQKQGLCSTSPSGSCMA
eukprot:scaffold37952_cov22-Tisochrysis_lutea.AAC.1